MHSLPSKFSYTDFFTWIKVHNYENVPENFGFNHGIISQYPSADLAVNVFCSIKGGCDNFIFWPFDKSDIGIFYYNKPSDFLGGARIISVNEAQSQRVEGVITKVYIPMLGKTFVPQAPSTNPYWIGKYGLGDKSYHFEHVDYSSLMMVVYLKVSALQSSQTRLLFADIPKCLSPSGAPCPNNSASTYESSSPVLAEAPVLINGTTWSLVSRQGVGPAFDQQPTELQYSYSVQNGLSDQKTFQLGLSLGLNIGESFESLTAGINAGLTASWQKQVTTQSLKSSMLTATCVNTNTEHGKVCPIYQLMATTLINTPEFDSIFADLNGPESKTPDVFWSIGVRSVTDDGYSIGTVYPIAGVFDSDLNITQRADYPEPLSLQ